MRVGCTVVALIRHSSSQTQLCSIALETSAQFDRNSETISSPSRELTQFFSQLKQNYRFISNAAESEATKLTRHVMWRWEHSFLPLQMVSVHKSGGRIKFPLPAGQAVPAKAHDRLKKTECRFFAFPSSPSPSHSQLHWTTDSLISFGRSPRYGGYNMPLVPPGLVRDEVFEIGVADGRGENVKRRLWLFSSLLPLSVIRRPIFAFFLSLSLSLSALVLQMKSWKIGKPVSIRIHSRWAGEKRAEANMEVVRKTGRLKASAAQIAWNVAALRPSGRLLKSTARRLAFNASLFASTAQQLVIFVRKMTKFDDWLNANVPRCKILPIYFAGKQLLNKGK